MQVSHHARVIRGRKWSINSQTVSELPISSMPWPRISIVTPSYNQGKYIERTVRSFLLQRYPNLEYILLDGGSTDDTLDRIAPYMKEFSYSVSQPDGGQAEAIANGFARSSVRLADLNIVLWAYCCSWDQVTAFQSGARSQLAVALDHVPDSDRRRCDAVGKFNQGRICKCVSGPLVLFSLGRLPSGSGAPAQRRIAACLELRFSSDGDQVRNSRTSGPIRRDC
jgi:hypothetical protein